MFVGVNRMVSLQLKVVESVVQSIMIFVVNNFTSQQLATKMLFHDVAMLAHLFAVDVNKTVSRIVNRSSLKTVMLITRDDFAATSVGTESSLLFLDMYTARHTVSRWIRKPLRHALIITWVSHLAGGRYVHN